ncbi:hypothetical protein PINS_up012030 [Pythium insidiosum]|nr:hypothetical protein PINS_up012030 [Pythium insidiosum]
MVQEGVAVALVLGIWSLMLIGCGIIYRKGKKRSRELELHAPLHPESTVHRLDAALSQAEEGFNVCSGCGFENFKRQHLLHDLRRSHGGAALGRHRSSPRKQRQEDAHLETQPHAVNAAHGDRLDDQRARQERARKRREWVRKQTSKDDSNGATYTWVRASDTSPQDADDAVRLPSVVPQFVPLSFPAWLPRDQDRRQPPTRATTLSRPLRRRRTENSSTASDSGLSMASSDAEPASATASPASPAAALVPIRITPEERVAELNAEVADMRLDLVPAAEVNAVQFPVDIDHSNAETKVSGTTEMYAEHFHRDFPSKLAEFVTATTELFVSPDTRHMKMPSRPRLGHRRLAQAAGAAAGQRRTRRVPNRLSQ